MKRWIVTTGLAVILLAPIASAGDWTQPRADPQSTGFTTDPGPAWPDIALRVELPGEGAWGGFPVVDGVAYVQYRDQDDSEGGGGVVAVDMDTGAKRTIIEQSGFDSMAADGERLYGLGNGTLVAYPLSGGEPLWIWAWPLLEREPQYTRCWRSMTLAEDHVLVGCTRRWLEDGQGATWSYQALVALVEADTGEAAWTWSGGAGTYAGDALPVPGAGDPAPEGQPGAAVNTAFHGFAVLGPRVLVAYEAWKEAGRCNESACVGAWHARSVVDGLDLQTGESVWRSYVPIEESQAVWTSYYDTLIGGRLLSAGPTGTDQVAFVLTEEGLQAVSPATGASVWDGTRQVGGQDTDPFYDASPGMAYDGEALFVPSAQTVHRFDPASGDLAWRTTLPPKTGERVEEDLLVTPERLYTGGWNREADTGGVYAFDKEDGSLLWRLPVADPQKMAISGDTLTFVNVGHSRPEPGFPGQDELIVLGRTQASPTPVADPSTTYPAPGETVRVDLSESHAGIEGPVTRYKAVWGDGTETDWKAEPILTHRYDGTGDTTARFIVGNANQTSSTTTTFHLGQTEPNWISERFEPDNQDMTFGVLGILVAVTGGAVGVTQRYRKRSRLQDELEALEEGFEQTRSNPGECEAFLDTRKARARSLLMDGDLTEEQFGVVERRVDDLHRELRTTVLDARFQFLPHGMVQAVKKMLADGRLSAWERDALDDLLGREETLSEAQREKVRAQLDRWFSEDRGGGAS